MRRFLLAASLPLVLAALYYGASPYLALHGLEQALLAGDAAELDERVDFAHVRQDMKGQLNAFLVKETEPGWNPAELLALGFAGHIVDRLVDSLVTPSGVAELARGVPPRLDEADPPSKSDPEPPAESAAREMFEGARLTRESLDRFSVRVTNERVPPGGAWK